MSSRPGSRGVVPGKEAASTAQPQDDTTAMGSGKFYYPDGATYEGQYKLTGLPPPVPEAPAKKGAAAKKKEEEAPPQPLEPPKRVRHGTGTYRSGDYVYEGEWMDDRICGQGRFVYASGSAYEGQWLNDKYQGKGRYSWPDGRAYEGDWEDSKMHGQGTFVSADGHRWAGQFFNGAGPGLTCQL